MQTSLMTVADLATLSDAHVYLLTFVNGETGEFVSDEEPWTKAEVEGWIRDGAWVVSCKEVVR